MASTKKKSVKKKAVAKASKFAGNEKTNFSVSASYGDSQFCCGATEIGSFGEELISDSEFENGDDTRIIDRLADAANTKFIYATTRENQKLAAEELAHRGFKAVGVAKRAKNYVLTFWLLTQ